ncbi:unnamed protein product, partial [Phaeothamnion confervicola]
VASEHRARLVPVVTRILFGRLMASSTRGSGGGGGAGGTSGGGGAKASPAARRAAVLSFLAGLAPLELAEFVFLMLRAFLPPDAVAAAAVAALTDVAGRQVGFLKMVGAVSKHLGHRVLPWIEHLTAAVVALVELAALMTREDAPPPPAAVAVEVTAGDDGDDGDEESDAESDDDDDEEGEKNGSNAEESGEKSDGTDSVAEEEDGGIAGDLRTNSLRALMELMEQFSDAFDFSSFAPRLWTALAPALARLPASCVGATRPPALLVLIETMARLPALGPCLAPETGADAAGVVPAALGCLSAGLPARGAGPAAVAASLSVVELLMAHEGGELLRPHLRLLVQCLAAPATAAAATQRELSILCQVAEFARGDEGAADGATAARLAALLLPRLAPQRKATAASRMDALGVVAALAPRLERPLGVWLGLAHLLGPAGPRAGLADMTVRAEVARCLAVVAAHPDMADGISGGSLAFGAPAAPFGAQVAVDLNAADGERIGEPDFARVVPALNALGDGDSWRRLVALRGAAVAALRRLVTEAALAAATAANAANVGGGGGGGVAKQAQTVATAVAFRELMEVVVLPGLRAGVSAQTETARKGFVMVLQTTVAVYAEAAKPPPADPTVSAAVLVSAVPAAAANGGARTLLLPRAVPADLAALLRPKDAEADFFNNLVHLQLHRRRRALTMLRSAIETAESRHSAALAAAAAAAAAAIGLLSACPFTVATLAHYLLPLALHPLHEGGGPKGTQHPPLANEAAAAVAAVCRHLRWSHYHRLLRAVMARLKRFPEKERTLVAELCAVLDAFHFPVRPPAPLLPPPLTSSSLLPMLPAAGSGSGGTASSGRGGVGGNGATLAGGGGGSGDDSGDADAGGGGGGDTVWRALTTRLLPGLRALMTKEVKDRTGAKAVVLRGAVAVAVVKLLRQLPEEVLQPQLPAVLAAVCAALKSRDSDSRDVARDALAAAAAELGPDRLAAVVAALSAALGSGFQLHVRTFTLHAVLSSVLADYAPPDAPSVDVFAGAAAMAEAEAANTAALAANAAASAGLPAFDRCVPELMGVLMEDLFGEVAAARRARDAGVDVAQSKMKEAKGAKAMDAVELVCRALLFRPTWTALPASALALAAAGAAVSAAHAVVTPLLLRVAGAEDQREAATAREALRRAAVGLAANPSATDVEVLTYVHATAAPFLARQRGGGSGYGGNYGGGAGGNEGEAYGSGDDDESSSDEDDEEGGSARPLHVVGAGGRVTPLGPPEIGAGGGGGKGGSARRWMMADAMGGSTTAAIAARVKHQAAWEAARVVDGAAAPKLTGHNRHAPRSSAAACSSSGGVGGVGGGRIGSGAGNGVATARPAGGRRAILSDPAAVAAVTFALSLLHGCLKRGVLGSGGNSSPRCRAMVDPFLPLLARCLDAKSGAGDEVTLLALRCLCMLLRWDPPLSGAAAAAPPVGRAALRLLVRAGTGALRGDLGQACFKALSLLLAMQVELFKDDGGDSTGNGNGNGG